MAHIDDASVTSCSSALTVKTSNVSANSKNKKKKKTACRRRTAMASEKEGCVPRDHGIIQNMVVISKLFVKLQTTDLHDSEKLERRLHRYENRVNRLPKELRESFFEQLSVYLNDRERLIEGERYITELPKMRERIAVLGDQLRESQKQVRESQKQVREIQKHCYEQVRSAIETEDSLRQELEVTQTQLHEARVQANKQAAKRVRALRHPDEDEEQLIPPSKRLRQTRAATGSVNCSPSPSINSNSTDVYELEKAAFMTEPDASSDCTSEEGAGNEMSKFQFPGGKHFVSVGKVLLTSSNTQTSAGESSWSRGNKTRTGSCSTSDSWATQVEDSSSDDDEERSEA